MSVFNYSLGGFWGLSKIFTSDGKHVTNSLIKFLIHCQYLKITKIVKRIELVFFTRHHFFKPMSDNFLCLSGMTPENIYVICAQAALFQCLLLTSFGLAEHGLKLVNYNWTDPGYFEGI